MNLNHNELFSRHTRICTQWRYISVWSSEKLAPYLKKFPRMSRRHFDGDHSACADGDRRKPSFKLNELRRLVSTQWFRALSLAVSRGVERERSKSHSIFWQYACRLLLCIFPPSNSYLVVEPTQSSHEDIYKFISTLGGCRWKDPDVIWHVTWCRAR
jgi:hypothetical protein